MQTITKKNEEYYSGIDNSLLKFKRNTFVKIMINNLLRKSKSNSH